MDQIVTLWDHTTTNPTILLYNRTDSPEALSWDKDCKPWQR